MPTYDSFLCTLIKGVDGIHEAAKYFKTLRDRRCYPGMKFFKVALNEYAKCHDIRLIELVWEVMVGKVGLQLDT